MLVAETFHGYIETTQDVLLIFEGCRRNLLPRIGRRLQERERKMIRSGSVFVFDEKESGIKRWTDGRVWSPSRILGNFLIYRELDKRMAGDKRLSMSAAVRSMRGLGDARSRSYSADQNCHPGDVSERCKERHLVGSLSDSYRFRQDGLIKKTMSIIINGVSQHLVSYYHPQDVMNSKLRTPSSVPELACLEISAELLSKQNFRIPPMVEPIMDPLDSGAHSPLTPPDTLSHFAGNFASASDRRGMHPLRSMSLGSGTLCESYGGPSYGGMGPSFYSNARMDLDMKLPTSSLPSFPQSPLSIPTVYCPTSTTGFPGMPSPSSVSSSPSTPMLSPLRSTFHAYSPYPLSSMSSTLPSTRYDALSYQQAKLSHEPPSSNFVSSTSYCGISCEENNNEYLPQYELSPKLDQLLNPIHPLHSFPAPTESHPSQTLLHQSISMTSDSPYTDYAERSMISNEFCNVKPSCDALEHRSLSLPTVVQQHGETKGVLGSTMHHDHWQHVSTYMDTPHDAVVYNNSMTAAVYSQQEMAMTDDPPYPV
ncbi:Gti1/Pac2 family-domain-containing protein [Radiomyces spectabilis]|uniref:Gti1/Pac2 family-domain-containing protein n=1 Tax=Radiomyces spectabilis TaxID=64574 RepID=UPI0022204150|nr:Gti1/Pac2 family-domain-containing protein [Radiomyces spectabilis]KAI8384839.1 Gti1/Pac2 family-domain-containing protein [Radiomyces spectabilis]